VSALAADRACGLGRGSTSFGGEAGAQGLQPSEIADQLGRWPDEARSVHPRSEELEHPARRLAAGGLDLLLDPLAGTGAGCSTPLSGVPRQSRSAVSSTA
jgi:hypothetical protein